VVGSGVGSASAAQSVIDRCPHPRRPGSRASVNRGGRGARRWVTMYSAAVPWADDVRVGPVERGSTVRLTLRPAARGPWGTAAPGRPATGVRAGRSLRVQRGLEPENPHVVGADVDHEPAASRKPARATDGWRTARSRRPQGHRSLLGGRQLATLHWFRWPTAARANLSNELAGGGGHGVEPRCRARGAVLAALRERPTVRNRAARRPRPGTVTALWRLSGQGRPMPTGAPCCGAVRRA